MSTKKLPTLVFLHGVGDGDPNAEWKKVLGPSLKEAGYPGLDHIKTISPLYAHALQGHDDALPIPPITSKKPSKERLRRHKRDVETRTAGLELMVGKHAERHGPGIFDPAFSLGTALPFLSQVKNYVQNPKIRSQVLRRILSKLPNQGKIVLIGHSLGSVIVADLLLRLPKDLEVMGLVTIGSPFAQGYFELDELKKDLREPPLTIPWWVNCWDPKDPVVFSRSVSTTIPWALDLRVDTGKALLNAHYSKAYLALPEVAHTIGFALFGSQSTDLVLAHSDDTSLTDLEFNSLVILSFAHQISTKLKGELKERYLGALRQVQCGVLQRVIEENNVVEGQTSGARLLPGRIARLLFDPLDPNSLLPAPVVPQTQDREFAAQLLVGIALQNIMTPFEIEVPAPIVADAIREVANEMGLKSQFGVDVLAAIKTAESILRGTPTVNWVKVGALGVGAAALVLGTGGLALAIGGAGFAGAAAIASGLAAFGPGGMIGGIITAGSLVGLGSGGLAAGVMSPSTTSAAVEHWLVQVLAVTIMRRSTTADVDTKTWETLVDLESRLRREHERIDEFSDPKSETVVSLRKKLVYLDRAVNFVANGQTAATTEDLSDLSLYVDKQLTDARERPVEIEPVR